jgi:transposase-like protein
MSNQTSNRFSPEVRSRAVRLVLDHELSVVIDFETGGGLI